MTTHNSGNAGPSHKAVETGVTVLIALFGVLVIVGSVKAGTGWGSEGPRAGFFPLYIGLCIVGASLINLWNNWREAEGLFAEWQQLRQVMSVLIPTIIYAAAIPFIGLYVASIIFIGAFMRWLGKYNWAMVTGVSIGVPVLAYLLFERWFLVPLPKGPIENLIGL